MVRVASISQAAAVAGRAFLLILGALIVLCFLRALLAAIVSAMLSLITPVIIWLAIGSVAAIALCVTRTFIPRLNKWLSRRSSREMR
jgi:hypothetical protein